MMTIHLSLLAMVVASAMHLVQIRFEARYLHSELQRALVRSRVLQQEHLELSAKAQSLAQSRNISEQAGKRLGMGTPTPWSTIGVAGRQHVRSTRPAAVQAVQVAIPAP
ncbi:cell division protein FtsL [Candidatus Symbiobacter mobilis]|uniref:Cell division protein FtsL n=1 Tax=Candidatus Symbiobacter mobilis CR TaxID=946483 RepID=U5N6J4_9BURK|nr:cell division protein FtsL [Candidatus Symbiobacter mobilis]AGX86997.1 hypothetical protein Cenrod_0894 [Candidatus Symbiobacter mobilis CR]